MAGTVVTGTVSTEEVLPEERKNDFDEKIRVLDPNESQFTIMTSRLPSRTAIREKFNWIEEDDFPRIVTGDAQTAGATTLNLTSGQGKTVQANDLIRNMRTGEMMRVTVVTTDALTIARGIGAIAAAATNAGDNYLVVGDAQPQGSDFPTPRYLARVLGYNYTQITRTGWKFTKTQTSIELYGGREPAKEAVRKAREHKRKWEAIAFWGGRSFTASSVAPAGNTEPQGTAGGAIEYIQSVKRDANGPLTPDFFDTFANDVFQYGSTDKVLFASPLVVASMSKWNRSGMGSQWQPTPEDVHGVKVNAFISGAYGNRIPVVVKKEWGRFPTANKGYGTYAFLIDMEYVQQVPLRDRDTQLLTEQQSKGQDTYAAEYLREGTFQFACEQAHGILYGVT